MPNTIGVPPELVDFWVDLLEARSDQAVFTLAAQWGYKQAVKELETVLKEIVDTPCNNSMTDHPITPPPELVQQWMTEYTETKPNCLGTEFIAARAAQWGADQELEACCEWLVGEGWFKYEHEAVEDLRAARRPKPPSLKEQAIQALELFIPFIESADKRAEADTIRRALEQLDD